MTFFRALSVLGFCWCLPMAVKICAAGEILGISEETLTGSYFSGGDKVLQLKGDFSLWTDKGIRDIWIDEDYGEAPPSVRETAALSQYPLLESVTFGRPFEIVHLKGAALREFQKSPKLKTLVLNLHAVDRELLSALEGFPELETLSIFVLGGKSDESIPPNSWGPTLLKLAKLEDLQISAAGDLTNEFLETLRNAMSLRGLSLRSAGFDERSFEIAGEMNLERLDISVPNLKDLKLKGLRKSGIRELHVGSVDLGRPVWMDG